LNQCDDCKNSLLCDSGCLPSILPLELVDRTMLERVGGKAANLGEIAGMGFEIPNGCVITIDVFDAALNAVSLPVGGKRYGFSFMNLHFPQDLYPHLKEWAERLAGPVAVRSSAVFEDSDQASYAGQLSSILNVEGFDQIVVAVEECWHSIFGQRVKTYSKLHNDGIDRLRMAVIVQEQVFPKAAGVMFTAHPITGNPEHTVIEAVSGIGNKLVDGVGTPNHWVIDRNSREVIESHIFNYVDVSEAELKALHDLGIKVQTLFGKPQDIEWALKDGKPLVLQCRPITSM